MTPDNFSAAVRNGCARSDRSRRARERAVFAAERLAALGQRELLAAYPVLPEAELCRALRSIGEVEPIIGEVDPVAIIAAWRRCPDLIAGALQ